MKKQYHALIFLALAVLIFFSCDVENGKPEPELYRLDIMGVKEQLSAKQKRRDFSTVDESKFIKIN